MPGYVRIPHTLPTWGSQRERIHVGNIHHLSFIITRPAAAAINQMNPTPNTTSRRHRSNKNTRSLNAWAYHIFPTIFKRKPNGFSELPYSFSELPYFFSELPYFLNNMASEKNYMATQKNYMASGRFWGAFFCNSGLGFRSCVNGRYSFKGIRRLPLRAVFLQTKKGGHKPPCHLSFITYHSSLRAPPVTA